MKEQTDNEKRLEKESEIRGKGRKRRRGESSVVLKLYQRRQTTQLAINVTVNYKTIKNVRRLA